MAVTFLPVAEGGRGRDSKIAGHYCIPGLKGKYSLVSKCRRVKSSPEISNLGVDNELK